MLQEALQQQLEEERALRGMEGKAWKEAEQVATARRQVVAAAEAREEAWRQKQQQAADKVKQDAEAKKKAEEMDVKASRGSTEGVLSGQLLRPSRTC